MCFSAEMDLAAGLVVTGIGIDTLRQARTRDQLAIATLPLVFGTHQLIETLVWWNLEGRVSTAVGELPSWLSDGAGLIVPPSDPRALGVAIESLLGDAALRRRFGERARARFLELGSERAVRPQLEAVIEALLVRGPGAAQDQAAERSAVAM